MYVKNTSEELCVSCSEISGCQKCDMYGCLECDTIFGFKLQDKRCVCDYGQYIHIEMNTCAQCRIEGCLDCDTETNCV